MSFMKELFTYSSLKEFEEKFSTDLKCLEFLAAVKWKKGFVCTKCGHSRYCKGKVPFSRRCTRCKHEESASSHTFFHGCKIPFRDAFKITSLVCHDPAISTYKLADMLKIRQMTCWKMKNKIIKCLKKRGELEYFTSQ